MKSFKQHVKDNEDFGTTAGLDHKGNPIALVDFGNRHQFEKNTDIDPSGMPVVLVDFGKRRKKFKLHEKAPAPTDTAVDHDFFEHHNENSDWGGTPNDHATEMHTWEGDEPLNQHTRAYSRYSAELNKSLLDHAKRGKQHPNKFFSEVHAFDLNKLDNEVNKNKLEFPLHAFSGVGFHPGKLAAQHPDRHVTLPAYTSTSLDKGTAAHFADSAGWMKSMNSGNTTKIGGDGYDRHIVHFHLPKGQKGKFIGKNGQYPHEHEYLLPRGQKVKIAEKPRKVQDGFGMDYHVWDAHPVAGGDDEAV